MFFIKKCSSKKIIENKPIPKAHFHEISLSAEVGYGLSVLIIISGIICIFFTDSLHKILPFLIATLMICLGTFDIIQGFRTGEYKSPETKLTSNGFMFLILGIVIFCYKTSSYTIIGAIWGTVGLIRGSEKLNTAICYISRKSPYIVELLSALIEFVLGILLLSEPSNNLHHHIVLLGMEAIVTGLHYIHTFNNSSKSYDNTD